MNRAAYRLVKSRTTQVEGMINVVPPKSTDTRSREWAQVARELDGLRLGYIWSGGVFDVDDPSRIWLIDEYGYMSHYLEAIEGPVPPPKKAADGTCPRCGEHGQFVRMALVCSTHGAYAGL